MISSHQKIDTCGVFHKYPADIFKPAFTGISIWELNENHIMNKYKTCKYYSIKSCVIVYSSNGFIFTPISNGDIMPQLLIPSKADNIEK